MGELSPTVMSTGALSDTYAPRILARLCHCFHVYTFIHSASAFVHKYKYTYYLCRAYDMTQPYFLIPCSTMRTILSLLSILEPKIPSEAFSARRPSSNQHNLSRIIVNEYLCYTDVSFCWRLYFMLVSYSTLYCSKCTSGK